ncbi:MAG: hypothetical protein J7501_14055 [Bdellovibrio sp.]|nr:hypothetical protein [Bdellovibrio sp.]
MRVFLAIATTLFLTLIASWSPAKAAVTDSRACDLSSEGIFNGAWVKHRISIGDQVLYGADNLEAISEELVSLRTQGLCK